MQFTFASTRTESDPILTKHDWKHFPWNIPRFSVLLWQIDPLLMPLHPPHYCKAIQIDPLLMPLHPPHYCKAIQIDPLLMPLHPPHYCKAIQIDPLLMPLDPPYYCKAIQIEVVRIFI